MLQVMWHYGGRGSWCHEVVEFLTRGCEHRMGIDGADRAIVVVKADQTPSVHQLNAELAQIDRGVLIVTGNEEGTFADDLIEHPRIKIWLQTPGPTQACFRALPWGWTPGNKSDQQERIFDWGFSGQCTHARREQCIGQLKKMPRGLLYVTDGFSKGLGRNLYWEMLASTRLAPCPSGPITVDSFRVCEALEAGAIPIVDAISPTGHYRAYWTRVFGDNLPFPIIENWDCLPAVMDTWLTDWESRAAICSAWWTRKKAEWLHQLVEDIA